MALIAAAASLQGDASVTADMTGHFRGTSSMAGDGAVSVAADVTHQAFAALA